jgi:hypothetical protein
VLAALLRTPLNPGAGDHVIRVVEQEGPSLPQRSRYGIAGHGLRSQFPYWPTKADGT